MKILKRTALCLLGAVLCISAFGCGKKDNSLSDPPALDLDQPILQGFGNSNLKPVTHTPVYASAFGDTIILATVPVEEWHSQESDCPPREISNGGRVKCNGAHEIETPVTKVVILEDITPRVCSGWFRDMIHLATIDGLDKIHTENVSDMSYMFAGCEKLTTLDLSSWDVSKVTDMTEMFKDCYTLEALPEWYE